MKAKPTRKRKRPAPKSPSAEDLPIVELDIAPQVAPPVHRARLSRVFRWLRRIAFALVVIALLPVLLTPLYRIEALRPISTLMVARVLTGYPMERKWVDLDAVAPVVWQSVIMSEDGQFCSHHGIDLAALRDEIGNALDGKATRGASTVTMQVAKNLYLWGGRSYIRKGFELPLAVWIDLVMPKHRIMEIYLNIAEWGPDGQFGIEAGANNRFSVSAANLSARQAALMAASLPNPVTRNPADPDRAMRRVADVIERRARQSGAYVECISEPLEAGG